MKDFRICNIFWGKNKVGKKKTYLGFCFLKKESKNNLANFEVIP